MNMPHDLWFSVHCSNLLLIGGTFSRSVACEVCIFDLELQCTGFTRVCVAGSLLKAASLSLVLH